MGIAAAGGTATIVWHRHAPARPARPKASSAFAHLLAGDWQNSGGVREVLRRILSTTDPQEIEALREATESTLRAHCGDDVRLRGLIEFSNRCALDCRYCGIRRGNRNLARYTLTLDEVVACARWCADQGYGSLVLQAGERRDRVFTRRVETMVRAIKAATRGATRPEGLGITLCLGEQSEETYARWFAAGAHRYLLRIETTSPTLFAALHPAEQRIETRIACLKTLRAMGYQVGTGVMIGLPGQTIEHLVDDLLFFRDMDIDMIGMGPYIPHADAVLPGAQAIPPAPERLRLGLRMIAAARLLLRDINIAATTALQAMTDDGREQGLCFGANVIMPQVTPPRVRPLYTLYEGKPCLDESAGQCAECLEMRIASVGRKIARDQWGDSARFAKRNLSRSRP
ncbi:MAG: [FeFe] hydrogenase H-cluster radical SAM maturase HydE [Zoogloeaceae bacterium]|jgi:biotin synthase|nr:[FeFe] hydrogenase H-cluster radical SAM maturase HydE [Zoogloeaceae bacterium]